jgi:serine/threonine-protein kinase
VLEGGPLPAGTALDLVAQVASALEAAHAEGVVHRDVKPANLLVRPDGTVVVTDFGIARSVHAAGSLTMTGEVLGTAAYLAPEQAEGRPASPATDVYSLGVVAYQCLAGRRPFEGETPVATALAHLRDAPPPLPADVPPAARAVVERAMAKDPAGRYPSAAALATAARAAARAPAMTAVLPTVAPAPIPPRTFRRPSPLATGVAAGVVLALLLGLGMTSVLLRSGGSAADGAATTRAPARSARTAVAVSRPTPPVRVLVPADYVGRPLAQVRRELTTLGLRVAVRQSGVQGIADRVVAITPLRVRVGGTVTVSVTVPYGAPAYDQKAEGKNWKGGGHHDEDRKD